MTFRGDDIARQNLVVDASMRPKALYVCSCGATRFKWTATNGTLTVGGFKPDEYIYECIGCGKKVDEKAVKAYFSRP